jgi:integrase
MGVKVREWKGAWWTFVNFKNRRVARRVGTGKAGKRAADLAAGQIATKLALGDLSPLEPTAPPAPAVSIPTFATIAEEWLERHPHLAGIRPSTLANYRSFVSHHLQPYFGDRPITALTPAAIEDFIVAKLSPDGSARYPGRALSRPSLRIGLVALRLICQRAVVRGHLVSNPVVGLGRFNRGTEPEKNVDPFTTAELRAILAAAHRLRSEIAPLVRVWAQTGMRAGEVCALQWHDLDLDRGTAVVRRTWSRGRLGPTKSGQARTVSLLHPILEDTAEWRAGVVPGATGALEALRRLPVRSLVPDASVFARGDAPIPSYWLHGEWRRILGAAGVRYRAPEQLRHTFASTMLSRNAPLLYVQKQGGWRSAAVLLRVYARWLPESAGMPPAATPAQPEGVASAVAAGK